MFTSAAHTLFPASLDSPHSAHCVNIKSSELSGRSGRGETQQQRKTQANCEHTKTDMGVLKCGLILGMMYVYSSVVSFHEWSRSPIGQLASERQTHPSLIKFGLKPDWSWSTQVLSDIQTDLGLFQCVLIPRLIWVYWSLVSYPEWCRSTKVRSDTKTNLGLQLVSYRLRGRLVLVYSNVVSSQTDIDLLMRCLIPRLIWV